MVKRSQRYIDFQKPPATGQWREMALLPNDWMDGRHVFVKCMRGKRELFAVWAAFYVNELPDGPRMGWWHVYPWKRGGGMLPPTHFWYDGTVQ